VLGADRVAGGEHRQRRRTHDRTSGSAKGKVRTASSPPQISMTPSLFCGARSIQIGSAELMTWRRRTSPEGSATRDSDASAKSNASRMRVSVAGHLSGSSAQS
jgi:hypothetical protein